MSAYDKTSIQINRCKRILELVDTYVDCPTQDYRTALRKALMEEFEAPAIAPPVAAGSVDTPVFQELMRWFRTACFDPYSNVETKAVHQTRAAIVAHIDAWGAQQREAGLHEGALVSLNNYDAACDEYRKQIATLTGRAEKAEAEQDTLKESLRLVNEDHGLWMARTHAAEDARDDALDRIKKLEERVEKLDTLHGASTA